MVRAYKEALFVPEIQITRKKLNASRHGNQKAGRVQKPDAHVQPSHETQTSTARVGCTNQQARRQLSPPRRKAESRSAKNERSSKWGNPLRPGGFFKRHQRQHPRYFNCKLAR